VHQPADLVANPFQNRRMRQYSRCLAHSRESKPRAVARFISFPFLKQKARVETLTWIKSESAAVISFNLMRINLRVGLLAMVRSPRMSKCGCNVEDYYYV
jgi:hypothetical protein